MALGGNLAGVARVLLRVDDDQYHADLRRDKAAFSEFATHAERETGRMSRGVLAGSGAFHHLGRSIAFASGAFLGAAGFTAVMKESVKLAEELQTQTVRTTAVFGDNARAVRDWAETTHKGLALTSGESLLAANNTGAFLKSMGVTGPAAATYSENLVKLGTQLARLRGIPIEDAMKAVNQGLVGRGRALAQLGIHIDAHAIKEKALADGLIKSVPVTEKVKLATDYLAIAHAKAADALAKYGQGTTQYVAAQDRVTKAQDALNKANAGAALPITNAQKAYVAYQIIMEQSGKTAQSYARWTHTLAGEQAQLHANIGQLQEGLGKTLLPVISNVVKGVNDWIGKGRNMETVSKDLNAVVHASVAIFKAVAGILKTVSNAVGGLKHLVELLALAFVAVKVIDMASWAARTVASFQSVGAAAVTTEGEVAALGTSITALGPLAVAAAGVAVLALAKIWNPTVGTTAIPGTSSSAVELDSNGKYVKVVRTAGRGPSATRRVPISKAEAARLVGGEQNLPGAGASVPTTLPGDTAGGPTGGAGAAVARAALGAQGTPYSWGGGGARGPSTGIGRGANTVGYDCSGLAQMALASVGVNIPRSSQDQFAKAHYHPSVMELMPGDLVFYEGSHPGHVAVYIGGGKVVHAPHTGTTVQTASVNMMPITGTARWWGGKTQTGGTTTPSTPTTTAPSIATSATDASMPVATGSPLTVGHTAKKPKKSLAHLIPAGLQIALTKAEIDKSTDEEMKALHAIEAFLEARIKSETNVNKKLKELEALKSVRDKISAIETAKDKAVAKEEAAKFKLGIDTVLNSIKGIIAQAHPSLTQTRDVTDATAAIADAQKGLAIAEANYAAAVKKYGQASVQAATAQRTVTHAQEAVAKVQAAAAKGTAGSVISRDFVGAPTVKFDPKTGKYIVVQIKPDVDALKVELDHILKKVLPKIDAEIKALKATIARLSRHPRKNKAQLAVMRARLAAKQQERKEVVALATDIAISIGDLEAAIKIDPEPEATSADTGGFSVPSDTSSGGSSGGGDSGGSSAPAGPSAAEIQAQVDAQAVGFLTGVRALRSFEQNIASNPELSQLLNPLATLGGSTINVQNFFPQGPPDEHLWSKGLEFELKALVG